MPLLSDGNEALGLHHRARTGLCQLQCVAACIEHYEMRGVPGVLFELPSDLGQLQRLIPKFTSLRGLYVHWNEVVGAAIRCAKPQVVEKADGARSRRLHAPRISIDRVV